jgi:hypothetical protein
MFHACAPARDRTVDATDPPIAVVQRTLRIRRLGCTSRGARIHGPRQKALLVVLELLCESGDAWALGGAHDRSSFRELLFVVTAAFRRHAP